MEIIVEKNWQNRTVKVYAREIQGSKEVFFGQKDDFIIQQSFEVNSPNFETPIIPLLQMPESLFRDFQKSFLEYLNNQNIKSENENLLQGKLSATEKHLEDLRNYFPKVLDKIISLP